MHYNVAYMKNLYTLINLMPLMFYKKIKVLQANYILCCFKKQITKINNVQITGFRCKFPNNSHDQYIKRHKITLPEINPNVMCRSIKIPIIVKQNLYCEKIIS